MEEVDCGLTPHIYSWWVADVQAVGCPIAEGVDSMAVVISAWAGNTPLLLLCTL